MQVMTGNEDAIFGGDINRHVDNEKVHGGYGFAKENEAGEKVLDFASSYELAIISTYFRKREKIT